MAHEIEYRNGQNAIAYVGATPWHKLGQQIAPDAPIGDWMKAAGLDWSVSTRPLYLEGMKDPIPGFKALARDDDDKVLDVVGSDWEPIQNYQAFEFFERFCKAGALTLETAGSLRGGRDVWVLAKASEAFELPGHDKMESYVLFDNPHQRGRAALIIPTPIRVVCANTQGWALEKHERMERKMEARFTHVGAGRYSIESAQEQLAIIEANFKAFEQFARFLAKRRCRKSQFEQFVTKVYGLTELKSDDAGAVARRREHNRRVIDQMLVIKDQAPGADMSAGTWWSAYNAVTYDVDHSPRRNVTSEAAMGSAWLGSGRDRKAFARNVALEMAA